MTTINVRSKVSQTVLCHVVKCLSSENSFQDHDSLEGVQSYKTDLINLSATKHATRRVLAKKEESGGRGKRDEMLEADLFFGKETGTAEKEKEKVQEPSLCSNNNDCADN